MTIQEDKLINNWETFLGLVEAKLSKELSEPLLKLCNDNSEKIMTAPASSNTKYVGAFPGGLVWHSINVLRNMKELRKVYDVSVGTHEMIVVALFHDIGKIGTADKDYYVAPKSSWHVDHGMPFQINDDFASVSVPTLSLALLQQYAVPLTFDSVCAINSMNNMKEMYASALYDVGTLTLILQQSVRACCVLNKGAQKL